MVTIRPKVISSEIVRIPEARGHLDDRIPVSPGLKVRFKLRSFFGILPVILAVGIELGRVAGCVQSVWAMKICGSKRNRGSVLYADVEFRWDGQDRIGSWRIG